MVEAVILGFRPHTYWTAVAALAGPADAPRVIERLRIDFATGDERFVFHQAAEGDIAAAPALLDQVRASTTRHAAEGLEPMLKGPTGNGIRLAVVPTGRPRPPQTLEQMLGSHSGVHAAEGEFYRDVVASACQGLGLEVRRVVERQIPGLLGELVGPELDSRLSTMGQALGPPWSEDQRLAVQAAWLGLFG